MTRPGLRRAAAVLVAALCGGGMAYLVVPDGWSAPGRSAVTESGPAGLGAPAATALPPAAWPPVGGSSRVEADGSSARQGASSPEAAGSEAGVPTRVVAERLGIDMAVVPQGVDAQGQMALPEDPGVAGWYRFGPAPASTAGAVVVAAHVDSRESGLGPFVRLTSARPGDSVLVEAGGLRWRYDVTQVVRVGKGTGNLAEVFARDGAPRLHLVTCTGRYDPASGYEANLVVVAERAEPVG